uniref:ATP-dependent RNA helicase n=1 Tax=Panagrolaimus superbus TaxID=310955 RepID=A0A914Y106_9BILA
MKSQKNGDGDEDIRDLKNNARNREIYNRFKQKKKGKKHRENIEGVTAKYKTISPEEASYFRKFKQFPLSSATIEGLNQAGFSEPTDIQRQSIFLSLIGNDVVGAAKTGSGKTIALLVPVLESLWRNRWTREDGLGALIITPTRELACQIFQVLNQIGKNHDFSAGVLIGGTDIEYERDRLGHVNIVIATPGRLLQHLDENESFRCDMLQILVIDEADRILDMGFKQQLNAIIENLPRERQTLLFSATQTRNVKDLARVCAKDPVFVSVHEHSDNVTPDNLQQSYFVCEEEEKVNILWSYLVNHKRKKTIIFVTCCKQARFLTDALCSMRPGLSLMGLWGTMNQTKRVEVFESFDKNTAGAALIATDVASRGLDFRKVDYVLQLDCPTTVEDYIHRVGRTARMNKKGEAVLVLTPSQEEPFLKRLGEKNIEVNKIHVDSKQLVDIRIKLSSTLSEHLEYKDFAQKAIIAYARAIHTMRLRDVFDVKKIDFQALSLSYGLAVAPRIRFLRKHGINVNGTSNGIKKDGDTKEDDEDTDTEAHLLPNKETAAAFNVEDDDDVLRVARKNVFNINPKEKLNEDELKPASKKKNTVLPKEKAVKKLIKRGALLSAKKIIFDDEGNPVEDTSAIQKFDINEALERLEKQRQQDKKHHREVLKTIRREKKKKQHASKEEDDTMDLGDDSGEDEGSVDLSWLPDPDKTNKFNDEEISDEDNDEPPKKKSKKTKKQSILNAEEQALSLLGLA